MILDNHVNKGAIWEVIDPQHQVIARFETEAVAEKYLETLKLPYKEFYKVEPAIVYGGVIEGVQYEGS